ncbi:DNA primase small subunit [Ischnura elegans]|uniref:DNA primase small subunit n=1 Tax=Ischnura elegans TaxID=197161 RepID=UPI001ED86E58|nr:DNA primase small subunit [Ischnura elegans]XP_046397247.1 DNA primase small subunit [Ischnura elegans]
METEDKYDPNSLHDLLPVFYKRLFPCGLFYKWLNYGEVKGTNFKFREFSFTLATDIYLRHLSFTSKDEMEKEILRLCPHKIDIGPVLNVRAKDHKIVIPKPVQRELVFDIDLTDYDEIRSCCQGGDVCTKCWKFMVVAIKVLDRALREDFGFQHLLWVFSGRRGIHCWVCDVVARMLDSQGRSAIVEYLSIFPTKKPTLTSIESYHSYIRRSYKICQQYFKTVVLEEQDMFAGDKGLERLLYMIDEPAFLEEVKMHLNRAGSSANSTTRWDIVSAAVKQRKNKGGGKRGGISESLFEEEMVLRYLMPRLDEHVTTGMGHLLKAPFCIHPKTGRLAMPINPKAVDKCDPNKTPPTITQLLKEIDAFDARSMEISSGGEGQLKVRDARKTSMHKSLVIFEEFLKGLENERKEDRLVVNDMKMEF